MQEFLMAVGGFTVVVVGVFALMGLVVVGAGAVVRIAKWLNTPL